MIKYHQSSCEGSGLIAAQNIEPNTFICDTHFLSPHVPGLWINITPNCLYNHSSRQENSRVLTAEKTKSLYTIKKIKSGEELYVNYYKDKDLEQPQSDWKE